MSFSILKKIGDEQKKKAVPDVRSGDTVKVTQRIKEGDKSRLQVFEGVVIRADRKESHTARITVRKIASGVGVEKSFLLHSPLVEKIEVVKRSKVRRNNLSYLRARSGKSARLAATDFDRAAVNDVSVAETAEAVAEAEAPKEESAADSKEPVAEVKEDPASAEKTEAEIAEAKTEEKAAEKAEPESAEK